MLSMKQFGKPRTYRPCNVRTPSRQRVGQRHAVAADQLEARTPAVVGAHLEARREDQAVESYVTPSTTTPDSVMRSTPRPWVSTSVTLSRLNACR